MSEMELVPMRRGIDNQFERGRSEGWGRVSRIGNNRSELSSPRSEDVRRPGRVALKSSGRSWLLSWINDIYSPRLPGATLAGMKHPGLLLFVLLASPPLLRPQPGTSTFT